MRQDLKSGLWLPEPPRLCSMFPAIHGVAGAAAVGIVKVQSADNTNVSATSVAATLGAAPTENNLLVAMAWMDSTSPIILSISGWTQAFSLQVDFGAGGDGTIACFYKTAGASESSTVTLTLSAAADSMGVSVSEFSQMATSGQLDVTATSDESDSDSTTADSGTTAATAQSKAVAVAGWVAADDDLTTPTFTNGFTEISTHSVDGGAAAGTMTVAFKILSATGTQQSSCTWAVGGAEQRWSGIAVFKGA